MKIHQSHMTASLCRTSGIVMSFGMQSERRKRLAVTCLRSATCNLILGALIAFAMVCQPLHSQNITADVLGTVTDPSGAVVPNAAVTIQDLGTNATRTAQTNDSGEYTFNLLPVGKYSLTIKETGFKPYKVTGFTTSAGNRLRIDVKLEVGASTQTVEVQAGVGLVQTDSSSLGDTVSQETVEDMPLNGRNITNLVTLQPGVNAGMPGTNTNGSHPDDRRQTSSVSANGQMEYFNDNVLDGIDNNERYYGMGGVKPSVEAVQEIKVLTANLPADTGRAGGAAVLVVTKAGTNQFHGDVYEYFRNDIFDAKEYFTPTTAPLNRVQEWRQNQFGGSLGGPIKKDKSFFFVSAEALRLVQGINSPLLQVPSASDQATSAYLPSSVAPTINRNIFNLFPLPNVGTNGYVSAPRQTQYTTTVDARFDEHFSSKDQLFARYNYNPTSTFIPGYMPACSNGSCNGNTADNGINPVGAGFVGAVQPAFPGSENVTSQGVEIDYTHIFNSNLLMELRTGLFRFNMYSNPPDLGSNAGTQLGIPNPDYPTDPLATGMPSIHFMDGSTDLGDQIATTIRNTGNNYQWNGDVIYTRGAHNLKVGAALIRRQLNYLQDWEPEGWFWEASPDAMLYGTAPIVEITQNTYYKQYLRSWETSVYAQDDWRARPWLTLNLGLRYDVFKPLSEAKNRYSNFDLDTLSFNLGGNGGVQTDYGNVAPRIGFAAQLGHWAVMHGGYGIIYYPGDFAVPINLYNPPYYNGVSCSPIGYSGGCSPYGAGSLSGGPLPSPANLSVSAVTDASYANSLSLVSKQTNFRASYLQQFNLTLQKQMGANAVTVSYVGDLGRRQPLTNGWYANLPQPNAQGVITLVDGAAPYYYTSLPGVGLIRYFENEATSNYNAMQLIFERRVATGLHVNANYTWSHGLGNSNGFNNGGTPSTWRFNYAYEYGNTDNDVKDRLAFTGTYDIPFGKTLHGAGSVLLKNWSLSTSGFWQTGLPFTVTDSAIASEVGGPYGDLQTALRVNVTSGQSYYSSSKSISNWLNPNAFSAPVLTDTTFTLGNERANQLYGPHVREVDLAAFKDVAIKENLRVQFRAECFNLSNTPSFQFPVNQWNASNFGTIVQTIYGMFPRVYQFALKLQY